MSDAFLSRLNKAGLDLHALEILSGGEVIYHCCPDGDRPYPVYSAAKSVTSAAFSLACDDGLVSPEMPLAAFLESPLRPLMSPAFKELPFHRFLTMTAGDYPFRPAGDHWLREILSLPVDHSDSSFHYSNIPAYLVGAAVENAVCRPLMSYLSERLFEPLGISAPEHQLSPEGHFYGATGMSLTVHELALLGQLYLQQGRWGDTALISRAAVEKSLTPHVITPAGDSYGYFFRIAEGHFSMVGKWGQRCIVMPGKGLTAAYLSHQPERSEELYRTVLRFVSEEL